MLTLLRHPAVLDRLRNEPDLIPATVEELLRYEPPVQFFANRTTLDEITLAGTTIPKGVLVTYALAAGNRDPARFPDPDRFDGTRAAAEAAAPGRGPPTLPSQSPPTWPRASADRSRWGA